ncbi:MAG: hypothetical protein RR982_00445 [Kiritimatiellia bacterium]
MNKFMVLALCLPFISCFSMACQHTGSTRKCVMCLRKNYQSYGCDEAFVCGRIGCPYDNQLSKHKHCGIHGAPITLTAECPHCAREEEESQRRDAEIKKREAELFSDLGIRIPKYRENINGAVRNNQMQTLQNRIDAVSKEIAKYEDRIYEPNMTEASIKRIECKIEELKFAKEVYMRAYELWNASNQN